MPLCRPAAPKHAGKQVKRGMPKIPLYYQDGEFFEEFGTSCYINHEKMVDVFPLYRHDFIEISLILDGCGTELCNGKYYPVQAGSVSVSAPWHFHTLHTGSSRPVTRFICEFNMQDYLHFASVWPEAHAALFDHNADFVVQLCEEDYRQSCDIFNQMYSIFTEKGPDRQVRLYLKLVEFTMLFRRAQKKDAIRAEKEDMPNDQLVQDALRYIHESYSKELNLALVAREVGASPSTLRELLLAYTGQDFQALLMEIRIRNACVLLGLKTPTLKYIAQNTGFGSVQTFYRAFQAQKGMTPEDFRKRHWMESEGKAGYLMYNNEIWALLAYLHLHFDDALSPESVARALGISTSYLHKMVKYNLMQSFSELLREIRVNYACGLLMNPALSVEQVAIEAGYNNSKTFIRAFQAEKGCTPGEFRGRAL